jgi:hypothetical protein
MPAARCARSVLARTASDGPGPVARGKPVERWGPGLPALASRPHIFAKAQVPGFATSSSRLSLRHLRGQRLRGGWPHSPVEVVTVTPVITHRTIAT